MPLKIFVTGATGYIGSAVSARLARAGHEVRGLTRTPNGVRALEACGARPVVGDISSINVWAGELKNCDVVVHAASDRSAPAVQDQKVLEAVKSAAVDGRVRRFLYTSGIWAYGDAGDAVIDESTPMRPLPLVKWRVAHEEVALDLIHHEVEAIVLQPAIVYGERRGILGGLFAEARDQGTVTVYGSGEQHWGAVHRSDLAEAYALALEHGKGGERYIVADESRHTQRQIAEAIARSTGANLAVVPAADVLGTLGPYGEALLTSQISTAGKARRELGWVPRHTSFVAEAEAMYREWQEGRQASVH
jgi:nucleoside-diphosphate-sugar epimerase